MERPPPNSNGFLTVTTLQQYAEAIWERQKVIAKKSGVELGMTPKELRVLNKSLVVVISTVIKTLVDKGVMTDAELLATLNAARDETYVDEPIWTPPEP